MKKAADGGKDKVAVALLRKEAEIRDTTALHVAAMRGLTSLFKRFFNFVKSMSTTSQTTLSTSFSISAVEVNSLDLKGNSAVFYAIDAGHDETVKEIVNNDEFDYTHHITQNHDIWAYLIQKDKLLLFKELYLAHRDSRKLYELRDHFSLAISVYQPQVAQWEDFLRSVN